MESNFSSIICVADINITGALDQCLNDLGLPEVFIQPAKQMFLVDRRGFLGLRPATRLDESRALLYRMNVPIEYEEGIIRRIAESTDLKMGGRGCIFAQRINLGRGTPLEFDREKLDKLCGKSSGPLPEDHVLVTCIVPRGGADTLAQAVLELGVCVPVIFFGTGMGLRDKLGLMRITIPVEKEIIWFIIPRSDADLVEKTLIPRARIDVPGKGFLYKCNITAPVVNLRIRQGKRAHAATMEQVIAALDEVQGSRDWRRLGSRAQGSAAGKSKTVSTYGLFFIGDEEEIETFRKTAMDNGARGATFCTAEMRSYNDPGQDHAMVSHSRQICDIIISRMVEEKLRDPLLKSGLFDNGRSCLLKIFDAEMPYVLRYLDTQPRE